MASLRTRRYRMVVPTARIWSTTGVGVPFAWIWARNVAGSVAMKRDWLRNR